MPHSTYFPPTPAMLRLHKEWRAEVIDGLMAAGVKQAAISGAYTENSSAICSTVSIYGRARYVATIRPFNITDAKLDETIIPFEEDA